MFYLGFLAPFHATTALVWAAETIVVASLLTLAAHFAGRQQKLPLGPAARHALWLVVLIKLVTPPLVHWPWSTPIATHVRGDAPAIFHEELHADGAPARTLALSPSATVRPANPAAFVRMASIASEPEPVVDSASAPSPHAFDAIQVTRGSTEIAPHAHGSRNGPGFGERAPEWLVALWLGGSLLFGIRQGVRILRSRRLVRAADPAPEWLEDVATEIGWQLRVNVPEIRVTPASVSPRLWCLGSPVLLIPKELISTLKADRWPGILMHELAHLKRGDAWVSRIVLAASVIWWWNPLFWWVTRRLEAEAELACDAWVVANLPHQRVVYAGSLVQICTLLSLARLPSPSLGVTGAGQFLERRLTMILNERVPCRIPVSGLLAAVLLFMLALPAWLMASPVSAANNTEPPLDAGAHSTAAQDPARDDDDADDDADDEDDADDDDDDADDEAVKGKIKEALGPDFEKRMEAIGEKIGKRMEAKFGPGSDFEKRMQAFGEKMESKFGPEFEAKMERFGKDMESKFGPEFQAKMERFGKEMEDAFGPEFQAQMERFGKEMEESFGPEFQESMKQLGDELQKELGPGSEFEKTVKQAAESARAKAAAAAESARARTNPNTDTPKPRADRAELRAKVAAARAAERAKAAEARAASREDRPARAKRSPEPTARSARIRALESRIQELVEELDRLKDLEDDDDESGEE